MLTITVRLDEKISTASQYENRTAGVLIEESNLVLHAPVDILKRTSELFALARASISEQLAPSAKGKPEGNGHNGNGHPPVTGQAPLPQDPPSGNRNGRRSHGRPKDEPTPKQRSFLRKIAKDRNLGPESIRDICRHILGKDPRNLDKQDMSRLNEGLLGVSSAS